MGGASTNLTKKSTSLYCINDKNMIHLQKQCMKFSEIDPALISQMLICVGKMPDGERINMLTTIFDKENLLSN